MVPSACRVRGADLVDRSRDPLCSAHGSGTRMTARAGVVMVAQVVSRPPGKGLLAGQVAVGQSGVHAWH
jgi:hypothetical protein